MIGTPLTAKAVGGNVVAVVPGASIVSADHHSKQFARGHAYTVTFWIWVAPNARHATVKVHADGGTVRHCSASKLSPGLAVSLSCSVKPTANHVIVTDMTINVARSHEQPRTVRARLHAPDHRLSRLGDEHRRSGCVKPA
jgi:hypothetical protein